MRTLHRFFWLSLWSLIFILSATPDLSAQDPSATKIEAFVSILPQAYFVERVGGPDVEVEVLVPPGQSPATFEPSPKQMAALAQADVYFRMGVPFENHFLPKVILSCPDLELVETRVGIELRPMTGGHGQGNSTLADPHTWLDPKLVKIQAENIARGLIRLDPTRETVYEENLRQFQADLTRVDSLIAEALAPVKGGKLYVFHPSYGYFADAYGLVQVAVESEGKQPGARQLVALIEAAKRDSAKVIFVQPQFSPKSAETVAKAIGGVVVPLDPLARDYLANLESMARQIKSVLSGDTDLGGNTEKK